MPVIKKNETLVDFVSNKMGTVSGLFYLANKNGISITEDVAPGVDLVYSQSEVDLLLKQSVIVPDYVPSVKGQVLKKYQNNFDFISEHVGTLELIFEMAKLNGISITEDVAPGVELNYSQSGADALLKQSVIVPEYVPAIKGQVLRKHQNNFDFVCQHAGTLEWIFEMAVLNGISITKIPEPGEIIKVEVADEKTAAAFDNTGYEIASEREEKEPIKLPGGIGYMKIESTFIVS